MSDVSPEGFAQALIPGPRPAVLAIDMMAAYYSTESPFCLPTTESLQGAREVITTARDVGVPVIHTRVSYSTEDMESLVFLRKIPALRLLSEEATLGRLMPQVAPLDGETVLVKQQASAFHDTDLDQRLTALGVDTVVLVGVSTSGCVRVTAVDAVARNYVPLVVRGAVGDRSPEVEEPTLSDLQTKYAEVVSVESILRYLRSSSGSESSAPPGSG